MYARRYSKIASNQISKKNEVNDPIISKPENLENLLLDSNKNKIYNANNVESIQLFDVVTKPESHEIETEENVSSEFTENNDNDNWTDEEIDDYYTYVDDYQLENDYQNYGEDDGNDQVVYGHGWFWAFFKTCTIVKTCKKLENKLN